MSVLFSKESAHEEVICEVMVLAPSQSSLKQDQLSILDTYLVTGLWVYISYSQLEQPDLANWSSVPKFGLEIQAWFLSKQGVKSMDIDLRNFSFIDLRS